MKRLNFLTLILILALFAAGCAPAVPAPSPTATSAPSITPTVTLTPAPSRTPTVTATRTPIPTATPLPSPGMHAYTTRVEYLSGSARLHATLRYLLFFPKEYGKDPGRKWPLILFLHGSGEMGEDLNQVKSVGLPGWVDQQDDFPFVMVAPQLSLPDQRSNMQPADATTYMRIWGWGRLIDPLNVLLDQIESAYAIDRARVYLTGLSLGGFGAWEYTYRYPDRFAAVAPIAGGYFSRAAKAPDGICKLKDTPIWAFHGDADTTVLPQDSQVLVDALRACGSAVKFTLYPGADHDESWKLAYADPALYRWFLEHP